jgi:hypothetical protein
VGDKKRKEDFLFRRWRILRIFKNACPVLGGVQDANHQNRFLIRFVENQIIAKFRHNKPTYLLVTKGGMTNPPSQFLMLRKKISDVKNRLANASCGFRVSAAM